MNSIQSNAPDISVTTPIDQALDRVKRVLFRPFNFERWVVIGFCAWLAQLGRVSGGGQFRTGSSEHSGNIHHELEQAREFVMNNLVWIVPVVALVVISLVALWVVLTWLSSRGKFMFLHCIALNTAEVRVPWNKYSVQGNSLCWFRIGLGLVSAVILLPLLALSAYSIIRMASHRALAVSDIVILSIATLGFVIIAIFLALIGKLTTDFVAPIMYLRGKKCLESWREFRGLLSARAGSFALFILMSIVLSIAISVMTWMVVLCTCCIACCFLAIPYIGTVLLLPVHVFTRAYALHFLAQFGPEYDVFPRETISVQPT
jgi:hypothetical protein